MMNAFPLDMTPRERFIAALERRPIKGRVPHFELEFFLTMEAFGRVHPSQRAYNQWQQMSESERELHRRDVADLYVQTVRRFELAGTIYHTPRGWQDHDVRLSLEHVRRLDGMEHVLALHGDTTYGLPDGNHMMDFIVQLVEQPQEMKDNARKAVEKALERGRLI